MKIAVVGAGAWGSALAFALGVKNEVIITSRTPRELENFVPLEEALACEYILFAISTQNVRSFLEANFKFTSQKILVASKGIETSTGSFLHDLFSEFLPPENISFLSGPSFAAEVKQKLPCALVISSQNEDLARIWADAFPPFIKTYTSSDVIGAEICGAYKNVIAIASGICAGLGLGHNARASLVARGLVEMCRFGKFFGGKEETFLGLSGAGDLFLTASSELSRNYRVGLGLARGLSLEAILAELGEVAEGVATTEAITAIAHNRAIYTPVANVVAELLHGGSIEEKLKEIMRRRID